ncbi:MFS transporter [Rhizosaccharibacter radicis]|uniref:MFS transporter n=1 Tax=Rhizosaccharibacter radicis TaxID=2782605 RepID=A0ABT1W024_9PROT|nr:MFS transporter [Acetobacteraceae bacterium KSS12]
MPDATGTRPVGAIDRRSGRGLDWLNFFVANLQTAFGPFIAVYLTQEHWTQGQIGQALSIGTITAMASQMPAGAVVDALRNKHVAAGSAIVAIILSCLMLAVLPFRLPVTVAEILHGFASCMLNPAIAALTLSLVAAASIDGPAGGFAASAALGARFGRNASFASVGNAVAAGLMGGVGWLVSARATFFLGAVLAIPGLLALRAIAHTAPVAGKADNPGGAIGSAVEPPGENVWQGLRRLLRDRRLFAFAVCVALFHLSNAGMLPLAAGQVTRQAGHLAELVIAACILAPQLVVSLLSPRIGRWAGLVGRRPVMLVCFAALPVRGVLMAMGPSPWMIVAIQLLDGLSSAAFGVMMPLVASDLSRGTGRFNLCLGFLGTAMGAGAALSTTLAGAVADVSLPLGFLVLAAAGGACLLAVWLLLAETAPLTKVRPA